MLIDQLIYLLHDRASTDDWKPQISSAITKEYTTGWSRVKVLCRVLTLLPNTLPKLVAASTRATEIIAATAAAAIDTFSISYENAHVLNILFELDIHINPTTIISADLMKLSGILVQDINPIAYARYTGSGGARKSRRNTRKRRATPRKHKVNKKRATRRR